MFFNPPFNVAIKNNIGKYFFGQIEKHFPKSNELSKIFDRNNLKLSYSTMPNFIKRVKSHNASILNRNNEQVPLECNCRKLPCVMNGRCRETNIVYKATVTAPSRPDMIYYGSTEPPLKLRWYNHTKSFTLEKYSSDTDTSSLNQI